MVEVSIGVSSGAARFQVAVRAESIQRATNLVATRYPGRVCRLKLPINPERFFVDDATAGAKVVGLERPNVIAA
ncbi:MAG TPA: hypothetical protein VF558_02285 [Rubrobacteraceae bacterium]